MHNNVVDQNIKITYHEDSNQATISFSGHISHQIELDLEKIKQYKIVNVDFSDVRFMNSLGIKRWFEVLEELPGDATIKYHNVPPNIVIQMSLVVGFLPKNSEVTSFYAPYYDQKTKDAQLVLLTPEDIKENKAPKVSNEKGEELFFDAIEEIYFRFLSINNNEEKK